MESTVVLNASSWPSLTGLVLLASLAGCGGLGAGQDASTADAPLAPVWSPDITFSSCDDFATTAIGSYVVQSNYWNKAVCPGTQCIEINTVNGDFAVSPGPPACGNNVASFPNVLYGCAYGNCSPGTMLPLPVTALSQASSTWSFAAAEGGSDAWNVGYDIWFCPDNNCGSSGFPHGLELMIWLDYKNAHGYKDHLGAVNLDGYSWDVWAASMAAGGALDSWNYMDYIVKGQMLTSVTDLDLLPFIKDAIARGYAGDSWYLYAIQAGMEVRSGGMPFVSNTFLVSINGVRPTHAPLPSTGPSCDGGIATAEGQLAVNDDYVTVGPLHGYADAWATPGPTSAASVIACGTPALGPTALCTTGGISADTTYNSTAGIGFYLNQDVGARIWPGVDAAAVPVGTITVPNSLSVSITKSGTFNGNTSLRAQLVDQDGNRFCYGGPLNVPIPITDFNTMCWNNTGDFAKPTTTFERLEIMVPSSAVSEEDFSYCLTGVTVQ